MAADRHLDLPPGRFYERACRRMSLRRLQGSDRFGFRREPHAAEYEPSWRDAPGPDVPPPYGHRSPAGEPESRSRGDRRSGSWRREREIRESRGGDWRSDPAWREMRERRALASDGFAPTYGRTGWEYGGAYGEDYSRDRDGSRSGQWERAFTASDIMTRDVKAASWDSSLQAVAQIMKEENCGIVPVVDENQRLLGVVTDRDMVIRTLPEGKAVAELKIKDIMTEDVEVVTPDEGIRDVIELMGKKQIRRVPVVDPDDRLAGIISMADIVNRADYDEDMQEALERISVPRAFWSRLWR